MTRGVRIAAAAAAAVLAAAGAARASSVLGLSIEDQARLARHVVLGEVVAQRGVDDPVGGIETEVTLHVQDALKGELAPGAELVFHTRGGEVDGVVSTAVGEAAFRTGEPALVFVEEVGGRLYLLGLSAGAWSVQVDDGGRVAFLRALAPGLEVAGDVRLETGPVAQARMAARVARAVREPLFDHPVLRETFGSGR